MMALIVVPVPQNLFFVDNPLYLWFNLSRKSLYAAMQKSQIDKKEVKEMEKKPFRKLLALYLMLAMFLLTLPSQGWAMFIPTSQAVLARQSDIITIQKTLETAVVKQRLRDFGLSPEEALARINSLSDNQIHQTAANLDSLQAGADGVGVLIVLLLVAVIVVVILQASGHKVIVR